MLVRSHSSHGHKAKERVANKRQLKCCLDVNPEWILNEFKHKFSQTIEEMRFHSFNFTHRLQFRISTEVV